MDARAARSWSAKPCCGKKIRAGIRRHEFESAAPLALRQEGMCFDELTHGPAAAQRPAPQLPAPRLAELRPQTSSGRPPQSGPHAGQGMEDRFSLLGVNPA